MKKIAIVIGVLILAGLGWWAIRPLIFDDEVNEEFPIIPSNTAPVELSITDDEFSAMDEEQKMEMEREIVEKLKEEPDVVMEEVMPQESSEPQQFKTGQFLGADDFHQGSGTATIYKQVDGGHLLRFEDFSVTNGPDLRVYLVKSADPDKKQVAKGVEIASLKGNKGNQNYIFPAEYDPADYESVVIYCKPFSVVFATANLELVNSSPENAEE